MQIHHYHPESYEYLGSSNLPRLSAHAVKSTPPKAGTKQKAVYSPKKKRWSLQADHRGTKVYHKETGEEIIWDRLGEIDSKYTTTAVPDDFLLGRGYSFSETNKQWQKPKPTLNQKKTNLRQRLFGALRSITSEVDNPLLTCVLLANISENELPITIGKKGLSQTETISNDDSAIAKETQIRSALLTKYKSIVGFAVRLNAVTTQAQLRTLETEINRSL